MSKKSKSDSPITDPSPEKLKRIASFLGLEITDKEARDYTQNLNLFLPQLRHLDSLPEIDNRKAFSNRRGYIPEKKDNPLNAFITRCHIRERENGFLNGMKVAIKDNISVAGIEMTGGSRVMKGFIPSIDATVVTRLLEAGATIVGKTNMDEFAVAGTSETSGFGFVINPKGKDLTPGGSSGGSAALVAKGEVEAALGTDGAGSVRIPASFCGVVGIKPTYGLVSRYGMIDLVPSLDHIGPIAKDVETAARVLSCMAGPDPKDPSTMGSINKDYTKALVTDISGMRIGIPKEFFEQTDPRIKETVQKEINRFNDLGAFTQEVSLPSLKEASAIWFGIALSEVATIFSQDGVPICRGGYYDGGFNESFAHRRRSLAREFGRDLKQLVITGIYLGWEYGNRYYIKAMNGRQLLTDDFERVLQEVDILAVPTVAILPFKFGELENSGGVDALIRNTLPLNLTGLPAISIPCARVENRPVGLQFIGRRLNEGTIVRAAYTYEKKLEAKEREE